MKEYFIPYSGNAPAYVFINGHKLIILSGDSSVIGDGLPVLGADRVRKVYSGETKEEENAFLNGLASKISAGVVVAPNDVEMEDIIQNLETELPWLH